jgi:two-component system CheB/CheR fusion protein
MLQKQTHVDFSHYKKTTLDRRIQRRMKIHQLETADHYRRFLMTHPEEVSALYADLLILVTRFFRDPLAFKALQEHIFPVLLSKSSKTLPIKIWVAGCSTGEEAYSILMTWIESSEQTGAQSRVEIYGTDLSEPALQTARLGVYPERIAQEVSPERLNRFFDHVKGGYQIHPALREPCLFSRQDVTTDPPQTQVDLISCRNLLIYFDPTLQKQVVTAFHTALRPEGFLWIGRSESLHRLPELFRPIHLMFRIYSPLGR